MKKIMIAIIIVLGFMSCSNNCLHETGWDGIYRVRLNATGTANSVDVTIKYQDEISGYKVVTLNNQTLPFEYPMDMQRGFSDKRVFVYISAFNPSGIGDVKVYLEYDKFKDGQYMNNLESDYDGSLNRSVTYAFID